MEEGSWKDAGGERSQPSKSGKRSTGGREESYARIIQRVFESRYQPGAERVDFEREDIVRAAKALGVNLPKNLGDVVYAFRYRRPLPQSVRERAPAGRDWIIRPSGRSRYRFEVVRLAWVRPTEGLVETKVPDATPGIIRMYALNDEQALLAKIRYNRLIDTFTGVTCYSLQSHLRTTLPDGSQIETDEVYVGVDKKGVHYVFPVQAKSAPDAISVVQIEQDLAMCGSKFPGLVCRPIGAQSLDADLIALFEFQRQEGEVRIAAERHYRLVPPEQVSGADLEAYRRAP